MNEPAIRVIKLGDRQIDAFPGDQGKEAFDHVGVVGNPHKTDWDGLLNKPVDLVNTAAMQAALLAMLPALPKEFPDKPGVAWVDGGLVRVTPRDIFEDGILNADGVLYSDSVLLGGD